MSLSAASRSESSQRADSHPQAQPPHAWLDRAIMVWLFVMALAAPHSIAATQIAWGCGMLLWIVRFALAPRPRLYRTPVDYALLGFFILTGVSSFFSYEPFVSIGKLRAASLFTIVYLVAQNVRSLRVARALAVALVASCMVNVVYTVGQRILGRGIRVENLSAESPLHKAGVLEGNTVLEADGRAVSSPEELVQALEANGASGASNTSSSGEGPVHLKVYSREMYWDLKAPRGQLLAGETALERLGIGGWSRGRDWRAAGFYGHYVTYAESLQLIASLAFGLFIALKRKRSRSGLLLALVFAGLCVALTLTVTRASWAALLVSACVIVVAGARPRLLLVILAGILLLAPVGLYVLQQKRNVNFLDQKDESVRWRETVWREGLRLLGNRPRHLAVGVGMDSLKAHWREWGLFDKGRLPVGHLHSNLLQLAVERGLPTLVVWLILLGIYAGMLWRLAHHADADGWIERGMALGALGGLAGFFTSGLVHYNWGDSEVVMIFYFILGLSLVVEREWIVHKPSVPSLDQSA